MPEGIPLPGRHAKPTERSIRRAQVGARQDIRLPEREYRDREDEGGTIVCPECHAISTGKRWFFDERLYAELSKQPDTKHKLCPGDKRIAEERYEGEVTLRSPSLLDASRRAEALSLIRNVTAEAHEDNPLHRVKVLSEGSQELYLVTATAHLAERIGKAFRDLWHADDLHPQGSVRIRLLKSAVRRNAAHRNEMEWPSP